jgi:hypothetical protein
MVNQTELIVQAYNNITSQFGISLSSLILILGIIAIWSLIWKGFALWKSARKNHIVWFIVLLIVNTLGVLEILYIFIFSKLDSNKTKKQKQR